MPVVINLSPKPTPKSYVPTTLTFTGHEGVLGSFFLGKTFTSNGESFCVVTINKDVFMKTVTIIAEKVFK